MPFALMFIGLVLTIAGIRNKQTDLFNLLLGDFTGQNNFVSWSVAILAVGSLGYVDQFKQFATAFLALLLAVLLFKKDLGFFSQFQKAINQTFGTTAQITPTPDLNLKSAVKNVSGVQTKSATGATTPYDFNSRDILGALMGQER